SSLAAPRVLHSFPTRRSSDLAVIGLSSFAEYRDYLELELEEFSQLFDSMLINVTGFFRDPLAWQALREQVIPELLSAKAVKTPVDRKSTRLNSSHDQISYAVF